MLEGPHLAQAALDAGLTLDTVLATQSFWENPETEALRRALGREPDFVAAPLLDELADADSPRGLVASTRLPVYTVDRLPVRPGGLYLYLDAIQDPGNLGAIARVAEAAGASALVCAPGTVHLTHPRAMRASAGSLLRLPCLAAATLSPVVRHLTAIDPVVVALSPRDGVSLFASEAPMAGAMILLLGTEGSGLDPVLLRSADARVSIPMSGPVESLNVATAAAVVAYEWRRRSMLMQR